MSGAYAQQWDQLRSIRSRLRISAVVLFAMAFFGKAISDFAGTAKFLLLPFVFAVGVVSAVVLAEAYVKNLRWTCPRCGQAFHSKDREMKAWANRCLHCGLPLWAEESEVTS